MSLIDEARLIEREIIKLGLAIEASSDGNVYDISTDEASLIIDDKNKEWELNAPKFVSYANSDDELWSKKLKELPYIFDSVVNNKIISRRKRLRKKYYYLKNGKYFDVDNLQPLDTEKSTKN